MVLYSSTQKFCASCALWGGARDPGMIFPSPTIKIARGALGRCMGGGFQNLNMAPTATCDKYKKWSALK
jgi:hypothetical protein